MDVAKTFVSLELWGGIFCVALAFCAGIGRNTRKKEGIIIAGLCLSSALLLVSDGFVELFNGEASDLGIVMLRVCRFLNSLVTYAALCWLTCFVSYSIDEGRDKTWVYLIYVLCGTLPLLLLIIAQFNGMYYTVDENNVMHPGKVAWLDNIGGIAGLFANVYMMMKHKRRVSKRRFSAFMTYIFISAVSITADNVFNLPFDMVDLSAILSAVLMYFTMQMELQDDLINQEKRINDMQVQIMVSQMQPHFLYNSLNTLYYLCKIDPERAQDGIKQFSDYLRGNITALKSNDPVSFVYELKHIQCYLALEKMRFDEELNIEYDIQTDDFKVPALTIQPLVENAVKHGIGKKKGGGTLKISTRFDDEYFIVEIKDDGVGFVVGSEPTGTGTHIGFQNVRQRVESLCGGKLEIMSEPGVGTVSLIKIPKGSDQTDK